MASGEDKRRRGGTLYGPVSFLIICAALVLGMSVFFRVSSIEVAGNSLYTTEEILEASGIEEGDNLFFIDRIAAVSRLKTRLPYVENAAIRRTLPNRVEIEISESTAMACGESESGLWAIDRSCKLLSSVSGDEAAILIPVSGLTAIAPQVGEHLEAGEANVGKVDYLSDILKQISVLELSGDVQSIDMSDASSPVFEYMGRFHVRLGSDTNLAYKFQLLISAVNKMQSGDRGTIDLSIDERAHLIQD